MPSWGVGDVNDHSLATREVYWGTIAPGLMYVLFAVTLAIFFYGIWRHIRLWQIGDGFDTGRLRPVLPRLKMAARYSLLLTKTMRDKMSGVSHFLLVWGFLFLTAATTVVFVHEDLGIPIMRGAFYLYFESFAVNVMGGLATIGVGVLLYKRFVVRPDRLRNPKRLHPGLQDGAVLLWLFVMLLQGFVLSAMRIAATHDPWGPYRPFAYALAVLFWKAGATTDGLLTGHQILWWVHAVTAFGWIASIPYWKQFHMLISVMNNYMRRMDRTEPLTRPMELETAESFGVSRINQFTKKDLIDLDSCTECGMCQSVCPAYASGKPLSPKVLIMDLRNHLRRVGARPVQQTANEEMRRDKSFPELVGEVVSEDTLWACTTCRACVEVCPVGIEQFPKIIDMRRYQVMEQSHFPDSMQEALRSLEMRGHPFPGTTASRVDWCKDLGIRNLSEDTNGEPIEVLYWVGCNAAFNERAQRTARAFATLMQRAGVQFGILGREERCTGDPARRIGNEFLFEMLARENVQTLQKYGVLKVVTTCPHCLNTLKNEYPQFGLRIEVYHHTQFLNQLIEQGKLQVDAGTVSDRSVTYHDPCYLARYNGEIHAPRAILQETGANLIEMSLSGFDSFCCGGGGGLTWFDDKSGQRINQMRARQAVETGADVVAVSCPFCMAMLEDGIKAGEKSGAAVMDVAEILAERVRGAASVQEASKV